MSELFGAVFFISIPAFIIFWWKKRKARLAAGEDYQSDADYQSKSKIKRIIGIVSVVSLVISIVTSPSAEERAAQKEAELKANRNIFVMDLEGDYKKLYDTKFSEYTSAGNSEDKAQELAVEDVKTKQAEDKKLAEEKAAADKAAKEAEEKRLAEEKAAQEKAEREAKAAEAARAKAEKAQQENNIQTVRNGHFYSHPDVTVGSAFKKFFVNGKWNAFTSTEGDQVVEFSGDCTWYDEPAKLTVQFIIKGNEFEMGHMNIDGVSMNYSESVGNLNKILEDY